MKKRGLTGCVVE